MYTIFFTNQGYRSPQLFTTLEEAKAHVQRVGFEASVEQLTMEANKMKTYDTVLTWSPLYGWRRQSVNMKVDDILKGAN